jgi:hypothetical protein
MDLGQHHRRSFLRGIVLLSAAPLAAGCAESMEPGEQPGDGDDELDAFVVRKSASAMDAEEIDRFVRAYEYAVSHGFFDAFNDEHNHHHHHRHHGADVLGTSPITIQTMPTTWGYRLLPWHRAFILEAERMLRAALRERNEAEGKDPAEAALVFIPYWDAAHDRGLPQWVLDFQPRGGTAPVVEGLPEGHAGHGKAVGERYDIEFGRWPGQNPVFDTLHTPEHVGRILENPEFVDFYDALDTNPEIVVANYPRAQGGLGVLEQLLPDSEAVATVAAGLSAPMTDADPEAQQAFTDALFELGWLAAVELRRPMPDMALVTAVKDVWSLFEFMPHVRMHLWAGGLAPDDANIRGTVTYFNELTVDPVFWMLHAELDRLWYTWETKHDGEPPLEGDDAVFQPMSPEPGEWYGGGASYALEELTDHTWLPYEYDALFE